MYNMLLWIFATKWCAKCKNGVPNAKMVCQMQKTRNLILPLAKKVLIDVEDLDIKLKHWLFYAKSDLFCHNLNGMD